MITIKYEPEKNRSAAYDKDLNIGECTYAISNGLWIINHTFVEKEYGGQGIAGRLVEEIVKQARESDTKIYPLCPFAKREFAKKPEYSDRLPK